MEKIRYFGNRASENGTSLRFFNFGSNERTDLSSQDEITTGQEESSSPIEHNKKLESESKCSIEIEAELDEKKLTESMHFWDDVCAIESHVHKNNEVKPRRKSSFIGDSSENWA